MGTGGRVSYKFGMKLSHSERESGGLGSSEGDFADFAERDFTRLQKDKISEVRN